MPHFCSLSCGADECICQLCGKVRCSNSKCPNGIEFEWRPDLTKDESMGLVCKDCAHLETRPKVDEPMSVYEHCRRESGLEGLALKKYIDRYYGLD